LPTSTHAAYALNYDIKIPNGTWSLYFNQNIHHSGDGASSWCMNFTENPVTVTATKGHTGRPPMGHMQQGQQSGASFSFAIQNHGDANSMGSTGDPDSTRAWAKASGW
jgi:hypothetical protein